MTSQFKSLRNKNSVYENEASELIDDFLMMQIPYKNEILRRSSFSKKTIKTKFHFYSYCDWTYEKLSNWLMIFLWWKFLIKTKFSGARHFPKKKQSKSNLIFIHIVTELTKYKVFKEILAIWPYFVMVIF